MARVPLILLWVAIKLFTLKSAALVKDRAQLIKALLGVLQDDCCIHFSQLKEQVNYFRKVLSSLVASMASFWVDNHTDLFKQ